MHKIFFYDKFIIRFYMFQALCAHHQEVKIVLYSLWYHHIYRWPSCAPDGHLKMWWYQMLYNTILTSWRWAHGARNMYRHEIKLLENKFCASSWLLTKINICTMSLTVTFPLLPAKRVPIVSVNITNWSVFVVKTSCVLCDVGTEPTPTHTHTNTVTIYWRPNAAVRRRRRRQHACLMSGRTSLRKSYLEYSYCFAQYI